MSTHGWLGARAAAVLTAALLVDPPRVLPEISSTRGRVRRSFMPPVSRSGGPGRYQAR